jgi:hypothetical protein
MIPGSRVDTVVDTDKLGRLHELMAHGHSRYPVLAADTGDIVGVVHLADLLTTTERDTAPVTTIRPPPLVLSVLTQSAGRQRKSDGVTRVHDPKIIRRWAEANNVGQPARGRIPQRIIDQFESDEEAKRNKAPVPDLFSESTS